MQLLFIQIILSETKGRHAALCFVSHSKEPLLPFFSLPCSLLYSVSRFDVSEAGNKGILWVSSVPALQMSLMFLEEE